MTDKQKEKLEKVLKEARSIGFGLFSLDPFYDKDAEKKVILEIYHKDNFFEHRPNTYLVKIGSYMNEMCIIDEYRSINIDMLIEIIRKY